MIERELQYVMQAQIAYLEGDRMHPFLEEIVSLMCTLTEAKRSYSQALYFWHHLLGIQERIYGQDRRELATVHRKLAVMYSYVGQAKTSFKYFEKSIELLHKWVDEAKTDGTKPDEIKEMKKDLSSIYLQAYFAANDSNNIPAAIEKIKKVTLIKTELFGDQTQEVVSNHFLTA